MPTFIIKAHPLKDVYIGWSTVTDSIHFWGNRQQVIEHEIEEAKRKAQDIIDGARREADDRLDRADETGTSALFGNPPAYGFETPYYIWMGKGLLRRDRLLEMLDTYDEGIGDFRGDHLLEPFEDDEEDAS